MALLGFLSRFLPPFSGFVFTCVLAVVLQIFIFSPISPDLLHLPEPSSLNSLPTNTILQGVGKLGEGIVKDPEDVLVDENGVLYTATRDGWIKRFHRDGSWENWTMLNSETLLGITATRRGGIIVCDSEKGLLWVDEDGLAKVLLSHVNGSELRFADDIIEASDGSLYFSVASTKFDLHNWYLDVLEAKPHGQLLKFDPSSSRTSIVLDDLGLANGVALSRDEDFLIVCETWKFRCLKHWLKGDEAGKTEIFIDSLPGGPDNINLAPDGSFWIALVQLTSEGWEFVHASKAAKRFIATYPSMIEKVKGVHRKASVLHVGADGKIIKKLDDPDAKVISFVTSAFEFEDHLYLGSLNSNFIGKLPLI
ncbi:protein STRICTOSIDINE SYNTHASE-LIKE 4-like [Syzygium oleosum]|uniref:protein STRICTOSIDINE SYNTHASE-LIKE 4-like n=1 Tax=Syzygium oleosum TaxID=219896 RepID=UPI0011D18201|nr:protein STRICTOSIDINE SYNTHASE-LIKE 4-like [Syzygium oleosum]